MSPHERLCGAVVVVPLLQLQVLLPSLLPWRAVAAVLVLRATTITTTVAIPQEYVAYFTGIRPVYLPSLTGYVSARYAPRPGKAFLFARAHHPLARRLLSDLRASQPSLPIASIEELYAGSAAKGGYAHSI